MTTRDTTTTGTTSADTPDAEALLAALTADATGAPAPAAPRRHRRRRHAAALRVIGGADATPLRTAGGVWPGVPAEYAGTPVLPAPWQALPDGGVAIPPRDEDDGPTMAAIRPMFLGQDLVDADAGTTRVEIVYVGADGEWHMHTARAGDLLQKPSFAQLADHGAPITGATINAAMAYTAACLRLPRGAVRTTAIAGRYGGLLVYPGGVWGVDGPVSDPPLRYAADASPEAITHVRLAPGATEVEVVDVLRMLLAAGDPAVTWTVLGWYAAAMHATLFRTMRDEFPFLNVYGSQGSGKTTFLECVNIAVIGNWSKPGSAVRAPFSILRELSATNGFPVVLDEYRIGDIKSDYLDTLHHFLRMAYTASRETRGRADQTTVDYRLTAPIVLAGESALQDPALIDRAVVVPVTRADLAGYPGGAEAMARLQSASADLLARVAGALWRTALATSERDIAALYATAARAVADADPDGALGHRPRHALAVVVAGALWAAPLAGHAPDEIPVGAMTARAVAVRAQAARDEGPVAGVLRFLQAQLAMPEGRRAVPIVLRGGEITVAQDALWAEYPAHCQRAKELWLGRDATRRAIEAAGIGRFDVVRRIGGRSHRCLVLSAAAIERAYGVPADAWAGPDADAAAASDDDAPF